MKMKIKVNDKVQVMSGKDKGKTGKVLQILPELDKVVAEGINVMYKHLKARSKTEKGQRVQFNGPVMISNLMLVCPKCNKGHLAITYSKKTRKEFIACNAYPECKNIYSLPPNGKIIKTEKICEECGFPKLQRLSKGKRPWEFCFNPKCPTNAEWVKKREENFQK